MVGLNAEKYLAIARAMPRTPGACRTLAENMGVLLYQAHPYRKGQHPAAPSDLSGVEVLNGSATPEENRRALETCLKAGYKPFGASDAHTTMQIGRYATEIPGYFTTVEELVEAIKTRECRPVYLSGFRPLEF